MEKIRKEGVLQKIASKLKESAIQSEELLMNKTICYKIDNLIQDVHDMIENKGAQQDMKASLSLILNGLENIRENYTYYMNTVARVTENYNTYLYVLEALYKENSRSLEISTQLLKSDLLN